MLDRTPELSELLKARKRIARRRSKDQAHQMTTGHLIAQMQVRKLSDIIKEMLESLLRDPCAAESPETFEVAVFCACAAWNESLGLPSTTKECCDAGRRLDADNPRFWEELKSTDIPAMIQELIEYKKAHFPDDERPIVDCVIANGRILVQWLLPANLLMPSER